MIRSKVFSKIGSRTFVFVVVVLKIFILLEIGNFAQLDVMLSAITSLPFINKADIFIKVCLIALAEFFNFLVSYSNISSYLIYFQLCPERKTKLLKNMSVRSYAPTRNKNVP